MPKCIYCEKEFIIERFELGYDYCLDNKCQIKGLDKLEREFRQEYTPALLHKSNYFWVKKSELKHLNVRGDILQQRD
jgi:hypothetical protein